MDRQLYEDFNRVLNPHLYQHTINTQQLFEAVINDDEVLLEKVLLESKLSQAVKNSLMKIAKISAKDLAIILLATGIVAGCSTKYDPSRHQLTTKQFNKMAQAEPRPKDERFNANEPGFCLNSPEVVDMMSKWNESRKLWKGKMPLKDNSVVNFNVVNPKEVVDLIASGLNSKEEIQDIYNFVAGHYKAHGHIYSLGRFSSLNLNNPGYFTKEMLGLRINCQNGVIVYMVPTMLDVKEQLVATNTGNEKVQGTNKYGKQFAKDFQQKPMPNIEFINYIEARQIKDANDKNKNNIGGDPSKGLNAKSYGRYFQSFSRTGPDMFFQSKAFIKMMLQINSSWRLKNIKRTGRDQDPMNKPQGQKENLPPRR